MRILVVEDDRKVASFIRQGLVEEGHTVETAADGDRALELLVEGEPYDLIVLDVMLPGRDGFAVLKGARQAGVHAPVIMLTARDSVADKVTGRILTRPMLVQHVWGLDFDPESNIVDVYVGYLRRKIDGPQERKLFHTIRGAGYVLKDEA